MFNKDKYYKILEIETNASEEDIKKAYKKLALKYHPDRNSEQDAEAKFKEISDAYQVLTNKSNPQQNIQGINPNDLFAQFFNMGGFPGRGGGQRFVNIGPSMFNHINGHQRHGMPGGIQINIANMPVNRSSVTTQIVNGQKIETIVEVRNGVISKKTRVTQLNS